MLKNAFKVVCLLAVVIGVPKTASAASFGFTCITNNSATNCATLQAQLDLDVTLRLPATSPGMVDFLFTNSGPAAASITAVYFDDASPAMLGNPATITESSGVSFSSTCTPGNLPGGNPIGFSSSYCADSDTPVQPMGVNPGEWLKLSYTLQGSATLNQVLAAMATGDYRVGIHVQGFSGGGSESAIAAVPEPASLILLGTGLFTTRLFRRRGRARG